MAIVNEIKCARCDRKYSGVRSRCPYCGARRIGRGKYSEDSDNAKGKMMISVLIMAVFVVAAGILLFTTPNGAEAQDPGDDISLSSSPEDDVDQLLGVHPDPSPEPSPTPSPEPIITTPLIELIEILYSGSRLRDDEFTMHVGDAPIPLNIRIDPPVPIDGLRIEWTSEDPEVFDVVVSPGSGGTGAYVHAIGVGTRDLTVTIDDVSATVKVRVRGPR